jgi:hypothetical protein
MRTEEERTPSGHGEVAAHPLDEIVVKCSVASLEDVDHSLPFVVEVAGGLGQFAVWKQVRLFQYLTELVLYLCQYGGGVFLSPFEVVLHRPTVFSYLVFVLFMVEFVDEFDHFLGFRLGVHAVNELPLDVPQTCYSCYIGEIIALYLSVEACRIAVHGAVIVVKLIVDDVSGTRAVTLDDIQQPALLAHDDPEVAFLHSLPLGVLLRDKYLEVGLVRSDVVVAEHSLAYGLVEVFQPLRRPAQKEAGCRLLQVEALVFKIMDDPFHRHGIHIAQLKKSGATKDEV